MLSMLLAYDSEGTVIATLDFMVARDGAGHPVGLLDFEAHERAGGKLRHIWNVAGAVGSGTWPEWLGSQAHDFRIEREPGGTRIGTLIHRKSGHQRTRKAIEAQIAERLSLARRAEKPADIRDLVGGPQLPLVLDDHGRTIGRSVKPSKRGTPGELPRVVRGSSRDADADGHRWTGEGA